MASNLMVEKNTLGLDICDKETLQYSPCSSDSNTKELRAAAESPNLIHVLISGFPVGIVSGPAIETCSPAAFLELFLQFPQSENPIATEPWVPL